MNEETFKAELFKTKFFDNSENNAQIICEKINKINIFFEIYQDKSKLVPGRDMTKKTNLKILKKAESINFYLSLDEKIRWIKLLDLDENEWNNIWNNYFSKKNK